MAGRFKLLEISVTCYGHDSEQRTDGTEVTSKGFLRNFVLGKKARYLISVTDKQDGKTLCCAALRCHERISDR